MDHALFLILVFSHMIVLSAFSKNNGTLYGFPIMLELNCEYSRVKSILHFASLYGISNIDIYLMCWRLQFLLNI